MLVSGVVYITVNDRLFGGLTPYAANGDADPLGHASVLDRVSRVTGVFADPWSGALLWAPFGVLALVAVWLLVRSYRERLAPVPDQVDVESSALLLALICGAVLLVAIVASPSLDGPWYAARDTPPRRLPAEQPSAPGATASSPALRRGSSTRSSPAAWTPPPRRRRSWDG